MWDRDAWAQVQRERFLIQSLGHSAPCTRRNKQLLKSTAFLIEQRRTRKFAKGCLHYLLVRMTTDDAKVSDSARLKKILAYIT